MDTKTESSNMSNNSQQCDKQILSKLRRLKIQETVLTQNLLKTEEKIYEDSQSNFPTFKSRSTLDGSDSVVKVNDFYRYVKNLFDEITTQTFSRELLAEIDIKEMKNKVLDFETKLKSLKFALNSELNALKSLEQELIYELTNEQPKETNKIKLNRKVSSAKYNDIVPSPVKTLMMSPFKCSEVQEFQDFMKSSGNRYGGWNEYNHNIFVKHWVKCFGSDFNFEWVNDNNLLSEEYKILIHDLLPKLQGISESDIKSHTKWYIKYLCLKNKQQEAIERWKWSKRSIRDIDKEVSKNETKQLLSRVGCLEETKINSHSNNDADIMSSKDYSTITNKIRKKIDLRSRSTDRMRRLPKTKDKKELSFSTLMKPTSQWLNRTYVHMEPCTSMTNYSVENIEKLCIPNWRLGLTS